MSKLFKTERKITPAHVHQEMAPTLSKGAKKAISMQGYTPRQKAANEVAAPANDIWARPVYRPGDGDSNTYVPRPGSLRAFSLPSRGIAT